MRRLSITLIILAILMNFALLFVSAQIIDVSIDGNSTVYMCYPYDYNVTIRNNSVNQSVTNINYVVTLPVGFNTTDPLTYNVLSLGPGLTNKIKIHVNTFCDVEGGNISVNGTYDYNNSQDTLSATKPITLYKGAVTIEKTPSTQNATLEEDVSWTITIKSSGLGPIKNVIITDTLGSGLQYISSSPEGALDAPGTYKWTSNEIPALSLMNPNDEVKIELKAKVIKCNNLTNIAKVTWGCDGGGECETQETIASIAFQPNPPKIDYTLPSFDLTYCGTENNFTIPITNTGGTAYDFNLSADFGPLTITNITSPSGASYSGGKFILGNVPNGTTNLTFDLTPTGNWCSDLPSGEVIFEPYYLYCGTNFLPPVKIGNYFVTGIPSLSVSKTGAPGSMYLGGTISYNIVASYSGPLNCNSSTTSNILVVDTIPVGFSIVNDGGGAVSGNKITWDVDPATGLNTTVVLQSPDYGNCNYCYTTAINTVNATITDCCGCVRTASSSQSTYLQCSETVTSTKTASSNYNFEKCTPIEYKNTYQFPDDEFWDDVNISSLKFREELTNNQVLVSPVKITIGSCSVDYTPLVSSYLDVNFSDTVLQNLILNTCSLDLNTTTVRNKEITIEYNLSNQKLSQPICESSYTFFDWSILNTGKSSGVGDCYDNSMQIRNGVFVTVNGAEVNVNLSNLPTIIDRCGTYIVTLNINRNSIGGAYNVNVSFPTNNYHVNNITINGGSPNQISGPNGYEWRYGDFFVNNTSASIDLNVTKRCDSNGQMTANVVWNDKCNNDAPDNICRGSTSLTPRLILSGNLCLMKVPELLWATTDEVTWRLCLTNAGSGGSYNVWLEDKLGSGLSYNSSTGTYSQVKINQDRNGNPINGATWFIPKIDAGDRTEILLTANIGACTNLTNNASTSAGCLGEDCQEIKEANSEVRIPPSEAITANNVPESISMCSEEEVTVIVKNTELTHVYDVNVTASLPTGITYVSGTSPDPENPSNNPLRWTKAQIPGLEDLAPSSEIAITFKIRSNCDMPSSGNIISQATYKSPCNDVKSSPEVASQIISRTPALSISKHGRNHTTGSLFASSVSAEPGDIVEWRLIISNNGSAAATNVEFYDVLPSNMNFGGISTSQYPNTGTTPSGSGTSADPWKHGTLSNVSGSNAATYYIWGTVKEEGCVGVTTNIAYVRYGCDNPYCRFNFIPSSSRSLMTRPNFSISQNIGTFTTCDGTITINVRNNIGYPTAYNVILTSDLPPGFIFDSMITGPDPTPNPPADLSKPIWSLGDMNASGTNTVIQFKVKNDGLSCDTVTPGTNNVRIDYQNKCGNDLNASNTSPTITPLRPIISVSKTPALQPVPPGGIGS